MLSQLNIPNISIQQSGTACLEITSIDAKKLSRLETAGFGDGQNDLPMLETVGLPIVMGNASDEIKKTAEFVTKSNDENGVAFALNSLPTLQN